MVYTVTFNPALDYVMNVKNLNTKDINRSSGEDLFFGGKGINVSVILSRLDIDNTALGFLAGFSGNKLEQMLKDEKIKTDFVYLKKGYTRINVKIKYSAELDINAQGPEIDADETEQLLSIVDNLEDNDILVLAGSIPKSVSSNIYEQILKKLSDRQIKFIVDATGDLLLNVLKYRPFMIKPNHHELSDLFGVEIKELVDIIKYAKLLQERGARNVLVSRGKDGAALIDETGKVHTMGIVPGKPVSSVGCGDSMVAGFIAGYLKSCDYSVALKMGSACANATAFSKSLASREEIEKMINNEHLR